MQTVTERSPGSFTKQPMVPASGYIRELDGLRFFAIAMVVLCHLGLPGCHMGWLGVPLFFVLSGYLITGILLGAKDRPHYFRNFYVRRVLRIFPIYYLVLAGILVFGIINKQPVSDAPYFFVYLQNYILGSKGWDTAFPAVYAIAWSLAVEEQFYLIWPVVVYTLSTRRLIQVALCLVPVAILSRFVLWHFFHRSALIYFSLASSMDSLVLGGLLAIAVRRGVSRSSARKLGLTACAVSAPLLFAPIIINGIGYYKTASYLKDPLHFFWLTAMAAFFTGIVAVTISGIGLWPRILRLRPLVHVGKISYGIYIYHTCCLAIMRWLVAQLHVEHAFALRTLLGTLFSYLVALASWHLLEKRFLAMKDRYTL